MKKLLLALALLFLADAAQAQETYSVSASAGQVASHERDRASRARATCLRLGQAVGCTQAQACTAANAAGGASCTAAQARAADARIYPATQAGREEFLTFSIIVPEFLSRIANAASSERAAAGVWFNAQNQTTKDAECVKWGLAAGCDPYN